MCHVRFHFDFKSMSQRGMGEEGSLVQEAETPYVILMASEPAFLAVVAHAVLLGWRGG